MIYKNTSESLYLNHASVARLPDATCDAMTQFIQTRQNPINYRQTLDTLSDKLREQFARTIDADSRSISLQANAATSFSILALGLDWKSGDEVILITQDFPSVSRPFISQLKQKGVNIISIEQDIFYADPVSELTKHISDKTKLFVTSWVGYTSGIRVDLVALGKVCKVHNIYFAVDATQGLGALPLSISKSPTIDFLVVSTYKWLMCPLGVGFFYISDALLKTLSPSIVGWLSSPPSLDTTAAAYFPTYDNAQKFENGGRPLIPYAGATASMDALLKIGIDTISTKTLALTKSLCETLTDIGLQLAYNYTDTNRSGIVILKENTGNKTLYDCLTTHNIQSTFRNNQIRFSPYFYQSSDDLAYLYSVLNDNKKLIT